MIDLISALGGGADGVNKSPDFEVLYGAQLILQITVPEWG